MHEDEDEDEDEPDDVAPAPRYDDLPEFDAPEPRVSLGPLSMLGFGPKSARSRYPSAPEPSSNVLVTTAALVIVIAGLKVGRPILVPLTVSVFLAVLIAPFVLYLKKHRVPPWVGVPLVVFLTVVLFAAVAGLVVGSLNTFIQEIPSYQSRIIAIMASPKKMLGGWGFHFTIESLSQLVQPAAVMRLAGNTLSEIADLLSNSFLVLITTIFVLFEALVLPDKIRDALADPEADLSQGIRVVSRIKAYVVIKTSTSLATGVVIGIILELMGIDFSLLWGLLAFLLNFIPNIGSVIAAIPAVLIALIQLGPTGALGTLAVFIGANTVIGNFLEPRIMGQRLNLSPLVVFVCLVFWGWLWGPIGMLLSVPLTMATRIMLEGNPATRPFAILMAGADGASAVAPTERAPRPR